MGEDRLLARSSLGYLLRVLSSLLQNMTMFYQIGQNHLATDEIVAAEVVNIPEVDTDTVQGSTAGSVPSFQEYLEYK